MLNLGGRGIMLAARFIGDRRLSGVGVAVVVALGMLVGAGTAAAVPGKPSLYGVPAKVMPSIEGTNQVVFGWAEVPFQFGGSTRLYSVFAQDLTTPGTTVSTTIYGTGNTAEDASAKIILTPGHRYRASVIAYENGVPGPTSDAREFLFDATGPTVDWMTVPLPWVRTPVITAVVGTFTPTDAKYAQVDVTSSGWPCPTSSAPACPVPLTSGGYLNSVQELPGGDGMKTVWARVRDDAQFTFTSRNPPIFDPRLKGNPGPGIYRQIGLDTTAPVARLVSTAVTGVAGSPVTLDATPSTDASSGVAPNRFEWRWGDGTPNSVDQPGRVTHTFPGPGTYNGIVIVRDQAGTPSAPRDTNFGSTTFTVTITPAGVPPVDPPVDPGPPPVDPGTPPANPGAPTPPAEPVDTTPLGPKKDIALQELTGAGSTLAKLTAKAAAGSLASIETPATVKAKQLIAVKLKLRKAAKVGLTLVDAKGKVVARRAPTAQRAGTFTARIRAPQKAARYSLVAKAGTQQLKLKLKVTGQR
jgi:hypothetical protein